MEKLMDGRAIVIEVLSSVNPRTTNFMETN